MIDWNQCALAFTDAHAEKLSNSRRFTPATVAKLRDARLVGMHKGCIAFPTTGGAHYKTFNGRWAYTEGAKTSPLVLGDLSKGGYVYITESTWDAIAVFDATGDPVICTRGAGNARIAIEPLSQTKQQAIAVPQNDQPGREWLKTLGEAIGDRPMKVLVVPDKYKDICEARMKGWTDGDVLNATLDAKDLTAVPVLAEPAPDGGCVPSVKGSGEARESTSPVDRQEATVSHSRGGGQTLTLPQVLDGIEAFFLKYVRFPEPWQPAVCALWCAYCWVWRAFEQTPYLLVRGPEENCGKTRVLRCVSVLMPSVYTGRIVAGTSEACLYHELDASHPVLLLDEIDENFAKGDEDPIVKVLNAGYEIGGSVSRWNMVTRKPDVFDVFCPKAFAGIGNNIKPTVASRCIHIHMARQPMDDMSAVFRERKAPAEVVHLKTFLLSWSANATDMLRGVEPVMPSELANDGRKADITEPLIAVADLAGQAWADKARESLICAFDQPKEDSEGTKLLRSIKNVFLTKCQERMSTQSLIEGLIDQTDEGPWATMWERDFAKGQWQGAAVKIGKMLKPYGIHSKTIRIGDDTFKGYDRADFERSWKRYLPSVVKHEQKELELVA